MAIHIRGVVLPSSEPVDLYVVDGKISLTKISGAETLANDCWIVPGLVDAHCHVGLGVQGAVSVEEATAQAKADLNSGVLLIRDAGSPSDTHWMDGHDDLPRIIRAGRHIARPKRYLRYLAVEIEPEELVEEVATQAQAGNGWVKLVGDWIDRPKGDLLPLWTPEGAKAAIDKAHEFGAQVTAHCFGEQSVVELVNAGIDCIEHGTGLDDDTIQLMADRGVPLVPTMFNLETFPAIAAQATKYPIYAKHMLALHARRLETIGKCRDAGIQIYAGTDSGTVHPHGIIAKEIALLATVGGVEFALGAASWRSRAWLAGEASDENPYDFLAEGADADLVIYRNNPLLDAEVAGRPDHVIRLGRIIR